MAEPWSTISRDRVLNSRQKLAIQRQYLTLNIVKVIKITLLAALTMAQLECGTLTQ